MWRNSGVVYYEDPDPQRAPVAKEILAKEIAGDPTQYNDPDCHRALARKENHAKAIVGDPTKDRVSNRLSQTP